MARQECDYYDAWQIVSNSITQTKDLGGGIVLDITIPSGYEYVAPYTFGTNDWTCILSSISVSNGTVSFVFRKMISGSASITANASIICKKI